MERQAAGPSGPCGNASWLVGKSGVSKQMISDSCHALCLSSILVTALHSKKVHCKNVYTTAEVFSMISIT